MVMVGVGAVEASVRQRDDAVAFARRTSLESLKTDEVDRLLPPGAAAATGDDGGAAPLEGFGLGLDLGDSVSSAEDADGDRRGNGCHGTRDADQDHDALR